MLFSIPAIFLWFLFNNCSQIHFTFIYNILLNMWNFKKKTEHWTGRETTSRHSCSSVLLMMHAKHRNIHLKHLQLLFFKITLCMGKHSVHICQLISSVGGKNHFSLTTRVLYLCLMHTILKLLGGKKKTNKHWVTLTFRSYKYCGQFELNFCDHRLYKLG